MHLSLCCGTLRQADSQPQPQTPNCGRHRRVSGSMPIQNGINHVRYSCKCCYSPRYWRTDFHAWAHVCFRTCQHSDLLRNGCGCSNCQCNHIDRCVNHSSSIFTDVQHCILASNESNIQRWLELRQPERHGADGLQAPRWYVCTTEPSPWCRSCTA